ncbi:MAG: HAD family phosphatase [Proteobacteria bacterium]|nr:HAD family phosphatase [Pseudomonadota bacterium]
MKLPRPVKAVVFDMDGLLFDTEKLYGRAILTAAQELGVEMTMDVFYLCVGTPWTENRARMIEAYGADYPAEELRVAWMRHFKLLANEGIELKPGVVAMLDLLDELELPRAIATSSGHSTVQHHLGAHGLLERFHHVIAAGDYARSKPAPDPFLAAAAKLGRDPRDCLALEDSLNGVRSASSAGMMTVMVPDLIAPTDEIRTLCAAVAGSLVDVPGLVRAAR